MSTVWSTDAETITVFIKLTKNQRSCHYNKHLNNHVVVSKSRPLDYKDAGSRFFVLGATEEETGERKTQRGGGGGGGLGEEKGGGGNYKI